MPTMRIQGKDIPYTSNNLKVTECILDPKNPRIQYLLGSQAGNMTEQQIEEALWSKDAVKALAQSILQNGGVREAIIVQRQDGRNIVREGNCRVVSGRKLSIQKPEDSRFETVPAWIFDAEISEEDVAVILADMHVASKLSWDAFEQAKLVSDLYTEYGKTYEWLANHLRLGRSKITELMEAYNATREYLQSHSDPINVRKFSFFHELMKKKELKQKYSLLKDKFHIWITGEKISDSKQVRDLPRILGSEKAVEALEKEGYEAAMKVLVTDDPSLGSDLFLAVKNATEALRRVPVEELKDLGAAPQKLIMLRNLKRALEDLATLAAIQI